MKKGDVDDDGDADEDVEDDCADDEWAVYCNDDDDGDDERCWRW